MSETVLRLPALKEKTGLGHAQIYALIDEGDFPRPIALGRRARGWLSSEIDEWLRSRLKADKWRPGKREAA
jgi:prophage regulatory protein